MRVVKRKFPFIGGHTENERKAKLKKNVYVSVKRDLLRICNKKNAQEIFTATCVLEFLRLYLLLIKLGRRSRFANL